MVKMFLLVLLCLGVSAASQAQCVIFTCNEKNIWAASYNDKYEHYTLSELGNLASAECKKKGGTRCRRLYASNKAGWWGLIFGKRANGDFVMQASEGEATESAAIAEAKRRYKMDGGVNADGYQVKTWYVYSNVKN
ncbi:MAG: hypothetical protein K0Q79_3509 [Flavipsychrobacter sp.]|jgi:hypothetical protein|nr:hypothetical protein [Flavipsychrobacter sp.]